ncbi:MAG: GNAT family N-acetyltransferase [Chlorobium sp.]|uniref:GNAT family N-acetyltransferase n=1 Tax=Chlorobium sp. TaxID=1095 RepID=UPI0025B84F02|nr:GNAT family N-acetyltransferase [Chlorobium sp.]MCF8382073.1 GNAT family N-acetyltransferase [Chlorobium sp.]
MSGITVQRVLGPEDRQGVIDIIEQVFLREKNWISSAHTQIPEELAAEQHFSWFLARVNGRPAGVLRLLYDPSLNLPEEYQVSFMPGIDAEYLKNQGRYVEIGRFMIPGEYRRNHRIALRLMRAATEEVVGRDYTHFITDVFENEQHSPLNFHTRVLGFEVIGRHLFGDLNCSSTRIILTLDILKLYSRVKDSRSRIYSELTAGLHSLLEYKKRKLQADISKS